MKVARTPEEIATMIEKIKASKKKLPEYSAFGDPNHLIADMQIEVLEGKILCEEDLYDRFADEGYDPDVSDTTAPGTARTIFDWLECSVEDDEIIDED